MNATRNRSRIERLEIRAGVRNDPLPHIVEVVVENREEVAALQAVEDLLDRNLATVCWDLLGLTELADDNGPFTAADYLGAVRVGPVAKRPPEDSSMNGDLVHENPTPRRRMPRCCAGRTDAGGDHPR